jgi:hypothetical protein
LTPTGGALAGAAIVGGGTLALAPDEPSHALAAAAAAGLIGFLVGAKPRPRSTDRQGPPGVEPAGFVTGGGICSAAAGNCLWCVHQDIGCEFLIYQIEQIPWWERTPRDWAKLKACAAFREHYNYHVVQVRGHGGPDCPAPHWNLSWLL